VKSGCVENATSTASEADEFWNGPLAALMSYGALRSSDRPRGWSPWGSGLARCWPLSGLRTGIWRRPPARGSRARSARSRWQSSGRGTPCRCHRSPRRRHDFARDEIDVVVAGAARRRVDRVAPVAGLRCVGVALFVAGRAVALVLRVHDVMKSANVLPKPKMPLETAGLDARQRLARVNLVDHHLKVDRVAGLRVERIRLVATSRSNCRSKRAPPWNDRLSWHALQVSLSTISRP